MCWQKTGSGRCWEPIPQGPGELDLLCCSTDLAKGRWGELLAGESCRPLSTSAGASGWTSCTRGWSRTPGKATCSARVYQASSPQLGSDTLSSHNISLALSTKKASGPAEKETFEGPIFIFYRADKNGYFGTERQ